MLIKQYLSSIDSFCRYLVFFENGDVSYVKHEDLRPICEQSYDVSKHFPKKLKEFIHKYMYTYPETQMTKLPMGHLIKVNCSGKWLDAEVVRVDASLVLVHFKSNRLNYKKEWIYRGSSRLGTQYLEEFQSQKPQLRARHATQTKVQIV